jgi:hypothetical protein
MVFSKNFKKSLPILPGGGLKRCRVIGFDSLEDGADIEY